MKKILHIVGNRPQFIKLAPLSRELQRRGYEDVILHTGQHYDENMSDIFFEELEIKKPEVNLQIGSGSHAEMTAKAMIGIEKTLLEQQPDFVILYGDTDTTLAAAIAVSKLNIPFAHVEAGSRVGIKANPEEMNRTVTDHLSTLLFCSDKKAVKNLEKEGITNLVYYSGDIMYDTFLFAANKKKCDVREKYHLEEKNYVLMTWHRQENTSSKDKIEKIIDFIKKIPMDILYPIHPRTRNLLKKYDLYKEFICIPNLKVIEPIGYFDMVDLAIHSSCIVTDSGGLSKESYFAGVPCYFMFDGRVWPDLEDMGWIQHINFDDEVQLEQMIKKVSDKKFILNNNEEFYGNGHTAEFIVDKIEQFFMGEK